jgi:hypothetical protein
MARCLIQAQLVDRLVPSGDMFQCCDSGYVRDDLDEDARILYLHESASSLSLLFQLLHRPPEPYLATEAPDSEADYVHIRQTIPVSVIPFPLLPTLFALADKYAVTPSIWDVCHSHLSAYASTYPLRVYGMAVGMGLNHIAARASKYLLHPPLATYTPEEIKVIPTAEAYHRLVLLHEYRTRKLRELLIEEQVFPLGYGECSRHTQRTKALWQTRKKQVVNQVEAGQNQYPRTYPSLYQLKVVLELQLPMLRQR